MLKENNLEDVKSPILTGIMIVLYFSWMLFFVSALFNFIAWGFDIHYQINQRALSGAIISTAMCVFSYYASKSINRLEIGKDRFIIIGFMLGIVGTILLMVFNVEYIIVLDFFMKKDTYYTLFIGFCFAGILSVAYHKNEFIYE